VIAATMKSQDGANRGIFFGDDGASESGGDERWFTAAALVFCWTIFSVTGR